LTEKKGQGSFDREQARTGEQPFMPGIGKARGRGGKVTAVEKRKKKKKNIHFRKTLRKKREAVEDPQRGGNTGAKCSAM